MAILNGKYKVKNSQNSYDVVHLETSASQVKFDDGKTFQEKLNEGTLKGDKGDKGATGSTGAKGDKGDKGDTGSAGVSVSSITQTTTSNSDAGTNVITATLSNGTKTTFNIKNGSKGSTGAKGDKGDKGADGLTTSVTVGSTKYTHSNGNITIPAYPTLSSLGAATSSHTHSNYVNQNAFSNVKVGSTTITSDNATDTLEIVAGSNIVLTPDTTNDKLTIAVNGLTVSSAEKSTWNAKETTSGSQSKADTALATAKSYTDTKVANLVGSAPETLNTLEELAKALNEHENEYDALLTTVGSKAEKTYVDTELAKKANSSHGTHVTWATTAPKAHGTATVGTVARVAREDHVHPVQTSVSGNAGTATKLATARTITVSGDMTGSTTYDGSANSNLAITLANSGATAGSYGPSANATASHGGTITIPQVTVDSKGRVTSAATRTITLPTDNNTDTKVTNTLAATTKAYVTGTTSASTNTGTQVFDTGVYLDTTAGMLTATTFKGTLSGNASTATTLQTPRTIAISGGATGTATSFNGSSNISIPITDIKESYLSWGGRNFSGTYGPLDASLIPELGANRLAFMPANAVTVEYSRDGGTTWTTYSTTDSNKINLFNGNGAGYIIGADSTTGIDKSKYMFRVTITAEKSNVYSQLNKFAIYCSTNGSSGSYCTIDVRTQANYKAGNNTWTTLVSKQGISGWSGWNIINTNIILGTNNDQYGQLRFTFGVTSHASSVTYAGLNISKILGYGGVGWGTPSTMAACGRMYTYDANQNVTFPAVVAATSFSGNASSATKATQDSAGQQINTTYIKGLSVSGKTITYTKGDGTTGTLTTQDTNTTYSVGTASALGLTKLYTGTGTATDGTMTQSAINTALNGKANSSHTHNSITNQDTRNVNTTPTQMPLGLSVHLKSNSTDGLNDGGTYHSTLMIKGWNDVSGGPWSQMAVTANNNLYFRSSNNDTWNAWKKVSLDGHTHSNYASSSHTHNYAGSSSAGGNANAAVKLATARTINGTNFDGSANITTAQWGTARTLTIGNTGKSVNGSGNVSWSLSEIGAAAASHGNHVPATQTADARKFLRNDNTWQSLPTASTSATGIVQLNDATNSTSTSQAATANAVKKAYDRAEQAFQSGNNVKQNLVDTLIAKGSESVSTSNSWEEIIEMINKSNIDLATPVFTVEDVGAPYGFVLRGDGYYESVNKGVDSSYAMCKVVIPAGKSGYYYMDCINYGEINYDYGIISRLNQTLPMNNNGSSTTSTTILHTFYNTSSPDVQTISLGQLPDGGFFYVKYRKDNITNEYSDSLKFKVRLSDKDEGGGGGNLPSGEIAIFDGYRHANEIGGGYNHIEASNASNHTIENGEFKIYSQGLSGSIETIYAKQAINLTNYTTLEFKGFSATPNNSTYTAEIGFYANGDSTRKFVVYSSFPKNAASTKSIGINNLNGDYVLAIRIQLNSVSSSVNVCIRDITIK